MKLILGKKWYRPTEIADKGLIQNSRGDASTPRGNYNFILELIKSGQLKANNYSAGVKAYYLVCEDEIERYHKEISGVK